MMINMPIKETIQATFGFVAKERKIFWTAIPMAAVMIIMVLISQALVVCDNDTGECSSNWLATIMMAIYALFNIGIVVNYCRSVMGEEAPDFVSKNFGKRVLFYLAAVLAISLFFVVVLIPCVVIMLLINDNPRMVTYILLMVVLPICGIIFAPLLLALPAAIMGDKQWCNPLRLFKLAKGSHNAIFWGLIITMLPDFAVNFIVVAIMVAAVGPQEAQGSLSIMVTALIMRLVTSALKGTYFGVIYRFFKKAESINRN